MTVARAKKGSVDPQDSPAPRARPRPISSALSATSSYDIDVAASDTPSAQESLYALQFLTYSYSVSFRRLAALQELTDVFDFKGAFDETFLIQWTSMSQPEQAAFSQSYRELRRMEALEAEFANAERGADASISLEERASRYVVAHGEGLERWQTVLREEARSAPRTVATAAVFSDPSPPSRADAVSFDDRADSIRNLIQQLIPGGNNDIRTVVETLAPIDDLAQSVLESMCSAEIEDAQTRFLSRVRWMLSLPSRQRIAVALRTAGKKRREIAQVMSISEDAVRAHLSRADGNWAKLLDNQKAPRVRGRAKA